MTEMSEISIDSQFSFLDLPLHVPVFALQIVEKSRQIVDGEHCQTRPSHSTPRKGSKVEHAQGQSRQKMQQNASCLLAHSETNLTSAAKEARRSGIDSHGAKRPFPLFGRRPPIPKFGVSAASTCRAEEHSGARILVDNHRLQ